MWARIESLARVARSGGVVATDADGTLWSGDVGEDLFHAFLEHERVEPPALEAMRREAREHTISDAGSGTDVARRIYESYRAGHFPEEAMCELMTWCFAGWAQSEVREFARAVSQQAGLPARMHRETLSVIERARRADLVVLVVSASPIDVVVEAAASAGFAEGEVVAARACFEAGVMVAQVDRPIPYGQGKVARLQQQIGEGRTLLAALGDNAFDVPLLASAPVGVAVRPKPRLRERAHEVPGLVELER